MSFSRVWKREWPENSSRIATRAEELGADGHEHHTRVGRTHDMSPRQGLFVQGESESKGDPMFPPG